MKIMVVKDRNVLNTKFLVEFVNSLSTLGHDIHVVSDSYVQKGSVDVLSQNVKFTNLNVKTKNPLVNIYRYLRGKLFFGSLRFSKFISQEKPDVIVCYFPVDLVNVTFIQSHNIHVIMMMHGYPPIIFNKYKRKPFFMRKIFYKAFNKASCYQVLMKSYEKTIADFCDVKNVVTIPNQVAQIPDAEIANLADEKKKIIYVARVEKEGKRQHFLVEAFAKIAESFPDWKIEFWGLQKYKKYNEELMELAKKHGIERNVTIMGYSNNIQDVYRDADIHAFPSLHEGFSLALADGMEMGLPSIGFEETPSVNELIVNGHNGYLVKNVDDFADKLKLLMEDKELRIRLGKNARDDMKAYSPDKIMAMWDKILKNSVKRS